MKAVGSHLCMEGCQLSRTNPEINRTAVVLGTASEISQAKTEMRANVRGRLLPNRNREHEEINLQPDL